MERTNAAKDVYTTCRRNSFGRHDFDGAEITARTSLYLRALFFILFSFCFNNRLFLVRIGYGARYTIAMRRRARCISNHAGRSIVDQHKRLISRSCDEVTGNVQNKSEEGQRKREFRSRKTGDEEDLERFRKTFRQTQRIWQQWESSNCVTYNPWSYSCGKWHVEPSSFS